MTFTGHFPGLFVDYDIFKSKGILLFFSFGAAQQAAYPCRKLQNTKWLYHIVISAAVKTYYFVQLFLFGS